MHTMEIRDKLKSNIVNRMRVLSDKLTAGRVTDYAGYKHVVGQICGLKDAMDGVDEVFDKLFDEQD